MTVDDGAAFSGRYFRQRVEAGGRDDIAAKHHIRTAGGDSYKSSGSASASESSAGNSNEYATRFRNDMDSRYPTLTPSRRYRIGCRVQQDELKACYKAYLDGARVEVDSMAECSHEEAAVEECEEYTSTTGQVSKERKESMSL